MNLHAVVGPAIGVINPLIQVSIQISAGYSTDASGRRVPAYNPPFVATAQVQSLQYNDIMITDGLNLQGVRKKIFLSGRIDGLIRSENKGGDLITFPDSVVWKVAVITDEWPDWTGAILTLQGDVS